MPVVCYQKILKRNSLFNWTCLCFSARSLRSEHWIGQYPGRSWHTTRAVMRRPNTCWRYVVRAISSAWRWRPVWGTSGARRMKVNTLLYIFHCCFGELLLLLHFLYFNLYVVESYPTIAWVRSDSDTILFYSISALPVDPKPTMQPRWILSLPRPHHEAGGVQPSLHALLTSCMLFHLQKFPSFACNINYTTVLHVVCDTRPKCRNKLTLLSKEVFVPNRLIEANMHRTIKVVKSTTAMVLDSKGVGCSTVPC